MKDSTGDRFVLGPGAQNMLRILIASYFLAGAIGMIPGAGLTPLTAWLLPESWSGPVAAVGVFTLSYMVMIGVWLRGAALLLAILTFWASYLRMMELGLAAELGSFWRDLALIASLMLTYAEPNAEATERRSLLRRRKPKHIRPRQVEAPPTAQTINNTSGYEPFQPTHGHDKLSVEELEHIFAEDFRLARSSG